MELPAGRGLFVVFEGGEGAGKSTQAKLLAERLKADGRRVVLTREPGGAPLAEAIREMLLDRDADAPGPRAEALLFAAARADHVARVIAPELRDGSVVICDRFVDSSLAYQGVGRGLGIEAVRQLSDFATGGLNPDLTIVLDVRSSEGLARVARDRPTDRIEAETIGFHDDARRAFLDLAAAEPDQYQVIPADIPQDTAAELVWIAVNRLPTTARHGR